MRWIASAAESGPLVMNCTVIVPAGSAGISRCSNAARSRCDCRVA